jgi:hypothetical protein
MNKPTWATIKAEAKDGHIDWRTSFDERQLKEINFDTIYADGFAHGTAGHNERLIIAKMAELLDLITSNMTIKADE